MNGSLRPRIWPFFRLGKMRRRRGQGWSAPEGLRDRGAKRMRSLHLPLLVGRVPEFCSRLRYNAKPHSTLVRVQGIRRKAQGKKLIPDPRPLRRSCRDYAPLQTCPPPAEQTSLARAIRSRLACPGARHGEAAPTAFLLSESTARREGRPDPRSQQVVRA